MNPPSVVASRSDAPTTWPRALIEVATLGVNSEYQPREAGLDEHYVKQLTDSDPEGWPPLLVTLDDAGNYAMVDGHHRRASESYLE